MTSQGVADLGGAVDATAEDEDPNAQPHERDSVRAHKRALWAARPAVQEGIAPTVVRARWVSDDAAVPHGPPARVKKVHFIRHGEGHHNAAQREWRSNPAWDGKSEPYTLETDPEFKLIDPTLTPKGEAEAAALRPRAARLNPDVLVVSPMRRATQTGLIAFADAVADRRLPVVACELAHEIAGKHTCDKRLPRAALAEAFPEVDYGHIEDEHDPFWGDGTRREPWDELAGRAARFLGWLRDREEKHVAVAAHSALLAAVFNGVVAYESDCDQRQLQAWFATGEMRTVELTWDT